ncbi:MAG TPA: hypothetical protein VFH68_00195 [Polyangia bacterium]|jgi:hypothetical protein|nr:hypothetical protein [Polyangia bacterium]
MKTTSQRFFLAARSSLTMALPLCALALACAGAAGCIVSVEAEIPDVEVTQKGLVFSGVPMGGARGDVSMTQSFSQEHDALELPDGLTSEVKAFEVSLTARQGISDFSFVHYLRLTMSDASNNSNAIELIDYVRDDSAVPSPALKMIASNQVNALEKWKTRSALFTIDIAGALPERDWVADITIRFGGKIRYQR